MGQLLSRNDPSSRPRAYSQPAMVLAFAASGSSTRQRQASWAGILPCELHGLILSHLPTPPDYENITGVVGAIGNGVGYGPGQFGNAGHAGGDLRFSPADCPGHVSFGLDDTVWAVDSRYSLSSSSSSLYACLN